MNNRIYNKFGDSISYIDHVAPWRMRRFIGRYCLRMFVVLIFGMGIYRYTGASCVYCDLFAKIVLTIILICFIGWVKVNLIEAMYLSVRRDMEVKGQDYNLLFFLNRLKKVSFPEAFIDSEIMSYVLVRSGISSLDIVHALEMDNPISIRDSVLRDDGIKSFKDVALKVFEISPSLRTLLLSNWISKDDWITLVEWAETHMDGLHKARYIWSKEALAKIQSIGTTWSYGKILTIEAHSRELFGKNVDKQTKIFLKPQLKLLENALIRHDSPNVLIVGSDDVGIETVLQYIVYTMRTGDAHFELQSKRIFELDLFGLLIKSGSRQEVELKMGTILHEAIQAGNVILFIPSFAEALEASRALSLDLSVLLNKALRNTNLSIITGTTRNAYHATVEINRGLLEHFSKIEVDDIPERLLREQILEKVLYVESEYNVFFSYQALDILGDSIIKISNGNIDDTEKDFLIECANKSRINSNSKRLTVYINRQMAEEFVAEKTGIKKSSNETEASMLLKLEEILSKRVIGQSEAITLISDVLRRLKAGTINSNRPVASFLFMGPTGVGKTETAKALASVYFGDEKSMIRFDMSEFSEADGLSKLIGHFGTGEVGLLASKAHDTIHGVLLLDEFEKSNDKVLNLFLQILDEGNFTDARGEKINMKNFIIIATSNADVSDFRPELINRFDAVVAFNVLDNDALKHISRLALEKYKERLLNTRSVELVVTDDLVDFIVEKVKQTIYGGRAINRVIQDSVESYVAKEILSGNLMPGTRFSLALNKQTKSLYSVYIKDNGTNTQIFIHSQTY